MSASSLFQKSSSSFLRRTLKTRAVDVRYLLSRPLSTVIDEPFQQTPPKVKIFDRDLKRRQRDRAAWLSRPINSFVDAVAENLVDRLEDCTKTFPTALCLGGSLLAVRRTLRNRGGIKKLIMMDTSYDMIKLCRDSELDAQNEDIETSFVVGDEEFLPIKESRSHN